MGRRAAIISFLVLAAGIIILGYFLQQNKKNLTADPFKVISPDAGIVIESIDIRSFINSLTTGKGLFSETGNVAEFTDFSMKLKFLADQINRPGYKKLFQEGKAVISFHPSEKGGFDTFLSKSVPAETSFRMIREALQESGAGSVSEKRYSGERLLEIPYTINGSQDTLFMALSSNLMLCSTSYKLITGALLKEAPGHDIRNVQGFSQLLLTSGNKENKIYIILSNLHKTLFRIFDLKGKPLTDKILNLCEGAGGEIFLNEEALTVSGYCETSDSSQSLFRFRSLSPVEFETYKVLPSATALFESMVFSPENLKPGINNISGEKLSGFAIRIGQFLGDEITKAYINIKNNPDSLNSLIIYKLKNRVGCENVFMESFGQTSEVSYFTPDDQTKIPVYLTRLSGLASILQPGFAPGFNDSWTAFYDNYMITGSSFACISRFLYDNLLHKTLMNDVLYRDFEKMVPSRAGYLFFCVPARCIDYLSKYFPGEIAAGLEKNRSSIEKIRSAGFQLASVNGMIYSNMSVSYKDIVVEESPTEWETLLDTTAAIKPFFFTNHNTGAREIFIQDIKNYAYLINAAGRVLWKVPLKERISGSVYMIDYYRNGKYQLLFSGKSNLHLLDRNGNYVERYPVRLRSPASNSLALFDYDNNQTYRLVIAGEDKLVYSYDKSGSTVKGWDPFRTSGFVTSEAVFCKVSGKDFIVVSDESSIYFLDRSGKQRLRLKDAVSKASGSSLKLNPGAQSSLVCSAPDGTVQNIFFNGEVKKTTFRNFSFDHSFDFFDVDGDGFGEYIFIDKGILYLYDDNLGAMFSKDFSSSRLGGPINFIFSATDRKIGVFDINKNLIYLVDSKGEIMKGFPLRGASMFSIGKLSGGDSWNLIVGGTDRFLYNYNLRSSSK